MRLRGEMLEIVHRWDAHEEIEDIEYEIDLIDEEDPGNAEHLEVLRDQVNGLVSGQYRAGVPMYNPFDEVEDHNWPAESAWFNKFDWARQQDVLRKRAGRRLAWRRKS